MKKYPNLEDFLNLNYNTIKDLIKSLGLVFRVDILENLAKEIKNEFGNIIPDSFAELKYLKGIGDYNANAILCFGFDQKRPLLDSNFIRIYKRVFNVSAKTKTPKTDKSLWQFSESLLPNENYINFNYAILDLGGTICLNRNPKCNKCPLNAICYYYNNKKN